MLVLSRKLGETIHISGDIVITVVSVQGDKVRMGIDAPRNVPVHRGEVADAIAREVAQIPGAEAVDYVV